MDKKKHLLFAKQAQVAAAMAHPVRIAILDFLKDGQQCVCDIADYAGSERSNVSRHLAVLVNAGLLEYHKDGLRVLYSLKCPCIQEFFSCVTGVLKEQAQDNKKLLRAL